MFENFSDQFQTVPADYSKMQIDTYDKEYPYKYSFFLLSSLRQNSHNHRLEEDICKKKEKITILLHVSFPLSLYQR